MEECELHQMPFCAVCTGIDKPQAHYASHTTNWWSEDEKRIAADPNLTTAEVSERLKRSVNNVSAYRISMLKMPSWKGNEGTRRHA